LLCVWTEKNGHHTHVNNNQQYEVLKIVIPKFKMTKRRTDGDETWNRLLNWTKGQKSERLAAHILSSEGFKSIDPSHPLGGKDGLKDIISIKDNLQWIGAAYFPRGQKNFAEIKKKFIGDINGIKKNKVSGLAFVTNQELTLSERKELKDIGKPHTIEIFHLERIAHILDNPQNYGIRLEFLDIELTKEEQLSFFASRDDKIVGLSEKLEHLMIDLGSFKRSFEVNEDSDIFKVRTEEDVYSALEMLVDQIWYNRHQGLKERVVKKETIVAPEVWEGALKAAKKIEKKYGEENLWHESDFEWGMLNGKVSALRWLMGDEWDMLDT
jgi:hypothetical protein